MTASKPDKAHENPAATPARTNRSSGGIEGVEIDAMLDRIDLVLRGQSKTTGLTSLSFLPDAARLNAMEVLHDLGEELGHLRELAEHAGDPELASFAREFRARVEGLVARKSAQAKRPPEPIEVEMDHERLHEFMLDPDYARVAG